MELNKKFDSFAAVEAALSVYEKITYTQYYKRNSRKLNSYAARCPRKDLTQRANFSLKFAVIDYSCIHGGKNFKSKAETRSNQK